MWDMCQIPENKYDKSEYHKYCAASDCANQMSPALIGCLIAAHFLCLDRWKALIWPWISIHFTYHEDGFLPVPALY